MSAWGLGAGYGGSWEAGRHQPLPESPILTLTTFLLLPRTLRRRGSSGCLPEVACGQTPLPAPYGPGPQLQVSQGRGGGGQGAE